MRVNQLALSQAVLPSLAKAGIHEVEQLAEHRIGELLRHPELSSGVALHQLICELHRHGLTPFARHGRHVQGGRELAMFRLRAVEGLTLEQIGARFGIKRERVRQLLNLHFGLTGVPPAARRRPTNQRPYTFTERRRLYLLARLAVQRHYRTPLTLATLAKTLATSPRQLQRAYAQFGDHGFRDDLLDMRMEAAVELLRSTSLPINDVARRVGYTNPSHFARAFRRRYGRSPSTRRTRSRQATRTHTGAYGALAA